MKLANIQLAGNEHGRLAPNTLYADLYDDDGRIHISADLNYILEAIRDRGYKVDGVTVKWERLGGKLCSTVSLDRYTRIK